MLPAISLGCWHNFGAAGTDAVRHSDESAMHENCRAMLRTAFDHGVTHFDLANNYGPPPGSAEERVGRILKQDFAAYRDELIVSSKAGYRMWPGPYGDRGSRKYLIASCEASLRRLGLDYVDVFYSHRPDADTPLEETMGALDQIVRSGKALYCGISSYGSTLTAEALRVCSENSLARPVIHQPAYSMLGREGVEGDFRDSVIRTCGEHGLGLIVFSPLAQGLLTDKYLDAIPDDSRAASKDGFLQAERVTPQLQAKLRKLNEIAQRRGQSLAQLALAWVLRDRRVTSALIGVSRPGQVTDCVKAVDAPALSGSELEQIDAILAD